MKQVKTLNECIEYGDEVRKKYRECLLCIGKSPDVHLYDLSEEDIAGRGYPKERGFLLRVLRFYESLLPKDKNIFIAEVLERYRHYPFWFMEHYRDKDFARRKDNILRKVSYGL